MTTDIALGTELPTIAYEHSLSGRLGFEYEAVDDDGSVTAYGGLPLVAEAMRAWGVEASIRRNVKVGRANST